MFECIDVLCGDGGMLRIPFLDTLYSGFGGFGYQNSSAYKPVESHCLRLFIVYLYSSIERHYTYVLRYFKDEI